MVKLSEVRGVSGACVVTKSKTMPSATWQKTTRTHGMALTVGIVSFRNFWNSEADVGAYA